MIKSDYREDIGYSKPSSSTYAQPDWSKNVLSKKYISPTVSPTMQWWLDKPENGKIKTIIESKVGISGLLCQKTKE